MEKLISDLESRGLGNAESILAHFVQEQLISTSRAAKVLKLMQANKTSKVFDVTQLHQLLEMISQHGKVDEDILINAITGTNLKSNKKEVTAAFYNWKRSPLARMLGSLGSQGQPGFQGTQEAVSTFQVASNHRRSPIRSESPRFKSPKRSPRRQASAESSDMEEGVFQCHGGCCQTASEETMSDTDVPQYPDINTELPTPEQITKAHKDKIDEMRKEHELQYGPISQAGTPSTPKNPSRRRSSRKSLDYQAQHHSNSMSDDEY